LAQGESSLRAASQVSSFPNRRASEERKEFRCQSQYKQNQHEQGIPLKYYENIDGKR
jgi:hypothetical protein